tara:strand:+ start:327 stop:812 length:486 start_codon:yes stop_codon:yes gene_type:complete
MSSWGNKDDKTSTGTVAIATSGVVTGTTTAFTTEAKVGDYMVINSTYQCIISSITSDTVAAVIPAQLGTSINAISVAAAYTLNEKPTSVGVTEVPSAVAGDPSKVFGVDTTEAGVTDTTHAGWVRRTVGTGGRSGRVMHEVLVASSSISGDAADDTELPDS